MNRKYSLILIVLFSLHHSLYSQSKVLTIIEAIEYMESVLNTDIKSQDNIYGGTKTIKIEIIDSELHIKYFWKDNKDVITYEYEKTGIDFNKIVFDAKDISNVFLKKYEKMYAVAIQCEDNTKNCFYEDENALKKHYAHKFVDNPKAVNHNDYLHLFYLNNQVNQKKVYNALSYILFELDKQNKELALIDPFVSGSKEVQKETVTLSKRNGVFTLSANLGGIKQVVMLDSGASDVSIPESFVNKLLEQGLISEKNFLAPGLYTIADGSVVKNKRFVIPYIKVNDVIVKNIRCSVNKSNDVFILGKAFLDRFKSWKINNETKQLILEL